VRGLVLKPLDGFALEAVGNHLGHRQRLLRIVWRRGSTIWPGRSEAEGYSPRRPSGQRVPWEVAVVVEECAVERGDGAAGNQVGTPTEDRSVMAIRSGGERSSWSFDSAAAGCRGLVTGPAASGSPLFRHETGGALGFLGLQGTPEGEDRVHEGPWWHMKWHKAVESSLECPVSPCRAVSSDGRAPDF
jgi:hypothetical protein